MCRLTGWLESPAILFCKLNCFFNFLARVSFPCQSFISFSLTVVNSFSFKFNIDFEITSEELESNQSHKQISQRLISCRKMARRFSASLCARLNFQIAPVPGSIVGAICNRESNPIGGFNPCGRNLLRATSISSLQNVSAETSLC